MMVSTNPGQAKEISVAVRAALGPVDLVQMLQGELEFRRQRFDSGAEISRSQRRKLVEHGLDDGRVDDDHDELERDPVGRVESS